MSDTHSITLLSITSFGNPSGNYDGVTTTFYSDKQKGDGFAGYTDGLHTVGYFPSNFVGDIVMQGSLATDPTDADWTDIAGTILSAGALVPASTAATINFVGNFVWVRAKVSNFTAGSISKIQYSY